MSLSDSGQEGITLLDGINFDVSLTEPLKIDAITDIYLDSFTTFNCFESDVIDAKGFY